MRTREGRVAGDALAYVWGRLACIIDDAEAGDPAAAHFYGSFLKELGAIRTIVSASEKMSIDEVRSARRAAEKLLKAYETAERKLADDYVQE